MVIPTKLTLAKQYLVVSLLVTLAGMVIIGTWVAQQIEQGVIARTAALTALYVDSFITPHLQSLDLSHNTLNEADVFALKSLLSDTPLGQEIVSFKVWSTNGTIIYSATRELIGRQLPPSDGLLRSLDGEIVSEISNLDEPEQAHERQFGDTLIETYAPIRNAQSGEIIAISEFYQMPDSLQAEIRNSQYQSWLAVASVMLSIYLILTGLVGRASRLLISQQDQLHHTVEQLHTLLEQNQRLNERVRRAAARTTTLNEQYLRRISADLHDGPAQDLALALLRVDCLETPCRDTSPEAVNDFNIVRQAIQSSLNELRTISAGLRLPEIEDVSPGEIVRRAVRDYEYKTQRSVKVTLKELPHEIPCSVKMTLYRVLKEALNNGYRHAEGKNQTVVAGTEKNYLTLQISDEGPGFDITAVPQNGHLGLVGMQERIEILGGRFHIQSSPDQGTTLHVALPVTFSEVLDE